MLRLTRLLIAFALALTIPVQGLAAATAGLCMAMGQHDAGMAAEHGHSHDSDQSSVHDDHQADSSSDDSHCAPCVACCAAAHISPATPAFIPDVSPAAAIAAMPSLPPGSLPEKLDRPPLAL